ncbi:hypothetical protein [Kozakia baliensis]|uniref:hypothetical protein n=1 Tax=Kozakia baliensis TaxID=153496 RepID=UPI0004965BCB|nr:hypothetical protein [Kozakia baliensis]
MSGLTIIIIALAVLGWGAMIGIYFKEHITQWVLNRFVPDAKPKRTENTPTFEEALPFRYGAARQTPPTENK